MEKDKHFQMRASQEFLDLIDDWRRHQPGIPSRAETIRQLVLFAVGATSIVKASGDIISTITELMKKNPDVFAPSSNDILKSLNEISRGLDYIKNTTDYETFNDIDYSKT